MWDIYDIYMFHIDCYEDEFPSMELIDGTERCPAEFWANDHELISDEEQHAINALLGGAA